MMIGTLYFGTGETGYLKFGIETYYCYEVSVIIQPRINLTKPSRDSLRALQQLSVLLLAVTS